MVRGATEIDRGARMIVVRDTKVMRGAAHSRGI